MILSGAQKQIHYGKHSRNIILKARQLGITTYEVVDMLDDVLFTNNFKAALIAHKQEAMEGIFEKVLLAWQHFPLKDALGLKAKQENKNELKFNNGSWIKITLSSRGDTLNRLHVSELAKMYREYPLRAKEVITGAIPSVVPDGRIDIEGTAEGEQGPFNDIFWDAWDRGREPNSKEFKAFFFPWTDEPQYAVKSSEMAESLPAELIEYGSLHKLTDEQLNWYYLERKQYKELMKQEFPTTPEEAFESSGSKIFDHDNLAKRVARDVEKGTTLGEWTFFEEYVPGHMYAVGADVAEGIGKDANTAVIIDFSHRIEYTVVPKVVAVYKNNRIDPVTFAYELRNAAVRYGGCVVCVERNNHGIATLSKLREIYHQIFKQHTLGRDVDVQTERLGYLTTAANKPNLIYNLKTAVEDNQILIPSRPILRELRAYDGDDLQRISYDPEISNHYDLVMALALSWEMRNHALPSGPVEITVEEPFDRYDLRKPLN